MMKTDKDEQTEDKLKYRFEAAGQVELATFDDFYR